MVSNVKIIISNTENPMTAQAKKIHTRILPIIVHTVLYVVHGSNVKIIIGDTRTLPIIVHTVLNVVHGSNVKIIIGDTENPNRSKRKNSQL